MLRVCRRCCAPPPRLPAPRGRRLGGAQSGGNGPVPSRRQTQQLLQPSHALFPSCPNSHVFLLCSLCRTAFPCQDPAPVTIPQTGPGCAEVSVRGKPRLPAPPQGLLHQRRHSARERAAGGDGDPGRVMELPLLWGPSPWGSPAKAAATAAPSAAPPSVTHLCPPRMHPLQMHPKSPAGPAAAGLGLPRRHPGVEAPMAASAALPAQTEGAELPGPRAARHGGWQEGGKPPPGKPGLTPRGAAGPPGAELGAAARGNPTAARRLRLDGGTGYGAQRGGAATRGAPHVPLPAPPSQVLSAQPLSLPPPPAGPRRLLGGARGPPGRGVRQEGPGHGGGLADPRTPSMGFLLTHRAMGNPSPHPRSESCRTSHGCYSLTTGTSWQQTAAPRPLGHPPCHAWGTGTTRDPTPGLVHSTFPNSQPRASGWWGRGCVGSLHARTSLHVLPGAAQRFPGAFSGKDAQRFFQRSTPGTPGLCSSSAPAGMQPVRPRCLSTCLSFPREGTAASALWQGGGTGSPSQLLGHW